jgi:hypothetical protein
VTVVEAAAMGLDPRSSGNTVAAAPGEEWVEIRRKHLAAAATLANDHRRQKFCHAIFPWHLRHPASWLTQEIAGHFKFSGIPSSDAES